MNDSIAKELMAPPLLYRLVNKVGKLMLIEYAIERGSNSGCGRRSSIKGRLPAFPPWLIKPASLAEEMGAAGNGVNSDLSGDRIRIRLQSFSEINDVSVGEVDGEVFAEEVVEVEVEEDTELEVDNVVTDTAGEREEECANEGEIPAADAGVKGDARMVERVGACLAIDIGTVWIDIGTGAACVTLTLIVVPIDGSISKGPGSGMVSNLPAIGDSCVVKDEDVGNEVAGIFPSARGPAKERGAMGPVESESILEKDPDLNGVGGAATTVSALHEAAVAVMEFLG